MHADVVSVNRSIILLIILISINRCSSSKHHFTQKVLGYQRGMTSSISEYL